MSPLNLTRPESGPEYVGSEFPATDVYQGPLINLRALRSAIWRKWRIWLAVGLAGMLIGAALHLVLPTKYSAVTELYLTYPANEDPLISSANDVSLAQTTAVANQALDRLHLHMTTASFLSSYKVVAVSDAIISITSSGPSSAAAVARADATAEAFLAVRNHERYLQATLLISGLHSQIGSLQSQVNRLTAEINGLSTTGSTSYSNRLTGLTNQRNSDDTQVSQLEAQIQQTRLNLVSVIRGSYAIDPATPIPVSRTRVMAIDGLTGLVIGIGSAMMFLLLTLLLSDRLRTREEVSAALGGVPVELSIPYAMKGRARRRHLLAPPSPLRMIERRLRDRLEAAPGTALAVVEVGTAKESALAVALLARSLALQNRRVMIVDVARGHPLASLFGGKKGVTQGEHTLDLGDQHLFLMVGPEDPAEAAENLSVPEGADAVLVLTSINPAFTLEHLCKWALDAVVVVNANKASASFIGSTGELLRRADIAIKSAIVIGGDRKDETVGASNIEDLSQALTQGLAPRHRTAP